LVEPAARFVAAAETIAHVRRVGQPIGGLRTNPILLPHLFRSRQSHQRRWARNIMTMPVGQVEEQARVQRPMALGPLEAGPLISVKELLQPEDGVTGGRVEGRWGGWP